MRTALSFSPQLTQNVMTNYKQFLHSHPHFWQLHTADGRQAFSIFNVTLSKLEINTGHRTASYTQCLNHIYSPPVFHLVTHPTIFWTSGTTVSFMAFLSTVDVAVLQNRQSLSMQYRWHATKKSREVHIQNILFVDQLNTEKYRLSFSTDLNGSATITIPMHYT